MPGVLQHAHKFAGPLKNAPTNSAAGSANGCFGYWQRMQRALGRHTGSKEAEPWGYIWVTRGSLVVGACACCGRWCDGTKILKSDLRLLLSAGPAFRTHSGRGRAQPMADNRQGTMGSGGAGGSASVSAAAASVNTPLVVRYNPPQDIELLLRDVYDFQQQPDKVAFVEGTRVGQISNVHTYINSLSATGEEPKRPIMSHHLAVRRRP